MISPTELSTELSTLVRGIDRWPKVNTSIGLRPFRADNNIYVKLDSYPQVFINDFNRLQGY